MVHLNGYVIGFGPRAQKPELQTKQIAPSEYLESYTVLYGIYKYVPL